MSETGDADSSRGQTITNRAFGQALLDARKKNNLTIEDVAKAINLSVNIVDAIERSDNSRLPGPIFVQGYLRNYARFVSVPEQQVLDVYNKVVPHGRETRLKPRAPAENEINLRTPVVLGVSVVLIVAGLVALGYGIYDYYSNKAGAMVAQIGFDEAQDRVEESYVLPVETKIRSELDDLLGVTEDDKAGEADIEAESSQNIEQEVLSIIDETLHVPEPELKTEDELSTFETPEVIGRSQVATQPIAPGDDEVKLTSSGDSWVEISDANGVILFYDLLPPNKSIKLRGTSPFDVFLGNAPVINIFVNDVELDMDEHIRSNNIAHYRVTVRGGQVLLTD